ncbi:MAG: LLM class flavin-dependent oxidoreductase [Fimbriimonas sp.]
MANSPIPFSILDLAFVREGETPGQALRDTREMARHAERLGYHRFWLAEHHNMSGVASAATSVAIGYVAEGTSTIRVGSGGIMLPNHAPLVIAEQFGTLASLYPGRIDLGLGRAPGTDGLTARALRRGLGNADTFPEDVQELQAYFQPAAPGQAVQAVPGEGLDVPIWLLGSSGFSAQLAGLLGLPFAFASHFAPDHLHAALELYRRDFRPSDVLDRPHAMVAANVVVADTEEEAISLFTSAQMGFLALHRGQPLKLQPPLRTMEGYWTPAERMGVERALRCSFVGTPETVRAKLERFLGETQADELIVTSRIYDQTARVRSFELLAEVRDAINAAPVS